MQNLSTCLVLEDRRRRVRNEQPGGYDNELAWWLNESQCIMGERGAEIKARVGGHNVGTKGVWVAKVEPYSDAVLGFGGRHDAGLIARARRCRKAWQLLEVTHRDVLLARYLFTVDESQKGLHGAAGEIAGVVLLVASKRPKPDKELEKVTAAQGWEAYAKAARKRSGLLATAIEACRVAHDAWRQCRVEVDQRGNQ